MRLNAQEKMGYYPTPPEVARMIATFLTVSEKGKIFRLLDPCAGEGKALRIIADYLFKKYPSRQFESYGIELDANRYIQAKELLDKVIQADALLETRISDNAFSLLFLNPPYDFSKKETEIYYSSSERCERKFLERYTKKLAPDGVLVLIVPISFIKTAANRNFLIRYYCKIEVFKFPERYFLPYKQLVIFAVKKQRNKEYTYDFEFSERLYRLSLDVDTISSLSQAEKTKFVLPPAKINSRPLFVSLRFDPDVLKKELKNHGLRLAELFFPPQPEEKLKTLMPLRKGHIALLLASGAMDGLIEKNGRRLLIKGFTEITHDEKTETDGDKTITTITSKPATIIRVLDLQEEKLFEVR